MKLLRVAVALLVLCAAVQVQAADRRLELSFQELINSQEARNAGIDGSVRFFLAGQPHPAVVSRHGEDVANKRTNGVGKSDAASCRHVALSALRAFQASAQARGANAVVDLVSFFRKNTFSSATHYECYAGSIMTAVTLKGTYAKID